MLLHGTLHAPGGIYACLVSAYFVFLGSSSSESTTGKGKNARGVLDMQIFKVKAP